MKIFLFLTVFSLSPGLALLLSSSRVALAQCVVTDVAIQVAVHGSRRPAQQTNDVTIDSTGPCLNNTVTSTSTQVHVGGTDDVRQARRVRHRIQGEQVSGPVTGGQPIIVPVEVQVDVYNAADRVRYSR